MKELIDGAINMLSTHFRMSLKLFDTAKGLPENELQFLCYLKFFRDSAETFVDTLLQVAGVMNGVPKDSTAVMFSFTSMVYDKERMDTVWKKVYQQHISARSAEQNTRS